MASKNGKQKKPLTLERIVKHAASKKIEVDEDLDVGELIVAVTKAVAEKYSDWDLAACQEAEATLRQEIDKIRAELERSEELLNEAIMADEEAFAAGAFSKDLQTPNTDKAQKRLEALRYSEWALSKDLAEISIATRGKAAVVIEDEIAEREPKVAELEAKLRELQEELNHARYALSDAQNELRGVRITKHDIGRLVSLLKGPRARPRASDFEMITYADVEPMPPDPGPVVPHASSR